MDLWQLVEHYRLNIMELTREIAGALGEGGVKTRRRLFRELEREVERYLDAMEAVVHPALARDERTESYVADLDHEHQEIRRFLGELAAVEPKDSRTWTRRFQALVFALDHYFGLQQHGALTVARSTLAPHAEALRRAFEREQIAAIQSQRWHIPKAAVPARYGISTGVALGTIAGVIGVALAAVAWRRRPAEAELTAWDVRERSRANRALREGQSVWLH
jgi:hypothetical protein